MAEGGCAKTVIFARDEKVLARNAENRITTIEFGEDPRD